MNGVGLCVQACTGHLARQVGGVYFGNSSSTRVLKIVEGPSRRSAPLLSMVLLEAHAFGAAPKAAQCSSASYMSASERSSAPP